MGPFTRLYLDPTFYWLLGISLVVLTFLGLRIYEVWNGRKSRKAIEASLNPGLEENVMKDILKSAMEQAETETAGDALSGNHDLMHRVLANLFRDGRAQATNLVELSFLQSTLLAANKQRGDMEAFIRDIRANVDEKAAEFTGLSPEIISYVLKNPGIAAKLQQHAAADVANQVESEAEPEVKAEAEPEVKAEAEPEVKAEAEPEVKAEAEPKEVLASIELVREEFARNPIVASQLRQNKIDPKDFDFETLPKRVVAFLKSYFHGLNGDGGKNHSIFLFLQSLEERLKVE